MIGRLSDRSGTWGDAPGDDQGVTFGVLRTQSAVPSSVNGRIGQNGLGSVSPLRVELPMKFEGALLVRISTHSALGRVLSPITKEPLFDPVPVGSRDSRGRPFYPYCRGWSPESGARILSEVHRQNKM